MPSMTWRLSYGHARGEAYTPLNYSHSRSLKCYCYKELPLLVRLGGSSSLGVTANSISVSRISCSLLPPCLRTPLRKDEGNGKCKGRLMMHASMPSLTEAEGEDFDADFEANESDGIHSGGLENEAHMKNGGIQGMAGAFNISSGTAGGITMAICLSALVLPFLMPSFGLGLTVKRKVLSYVTLLFGFYMAWNIGANDVANAMGTSVGSGALTLRQAVMTAAVLEFMGAFLVGSHVSHTMQKGILVADIFNGRESLLLSGMLSSLAAAGTWLQVASYFGWPVSTTHCIIGAMVGFGLIYGGIEAVFWKSLARVVSSWVISPLLGAAMSYIVYKCIRMFVYSAANPGQAAATAAPILVFIGVSGMAYSAFPLSLNPLVLAAQALGLGLLGALSISFIIHQQLGKLLEDSPTSVNSVESDEARPPMKLNFMSKIDGPTGNNLRIVYGVFGYLQALLATLILVWLFHRNILFGAKFMQPKVLSACFMSFAHGANDVANAIGPISAALAIIQGTGLGGHVAMPTDVLAWGGFGIVAGLMVWGYRVIATIGKKITELTPTRGFAAEFAAATVVVLASRLGLPISATHTLVGAVMGVGFARGLKSVRVETVRGIVISWLVTIPVGAALSVIFTAILRTLLPTVI